MMMSSAGSLEKSSITRNLLQIYKEMSIGIMMVNEVELFRYKRIDLHIGSSPNRNQTFN